MTARDGYDFRLNEVYRIKEKLERTKTEREKLRIRYEKLVNCSAGLLATATIGAAASGTTTVLSGASVIGAPVAVVSGLGLGFTIIGGILSTISLGIFRIKHAKHKDLQELANNKLDDFNEIFSKAMNDNKISDEEYRLLLTVSKNFDKEVAKIRKEKKISTKEILSDAIEQMRKLAEEVQVLKNERASS